MFLITDVNLLKLLSVVCGFGSLTYICKNYMQNICSVTLIPLELAQISSFEVCTSFSFEFKREKCNVFENYSMPLRGFRVLATIVCIFMRDLANNWFKDFYFIFQSKPN